MSELVSREEFDMLSQQVRANSEMTERCFNRILQGQEKIHENINKQKLLNSENASAIKYIKLDVSYIKSDKIWLNRLVVGFVFLTAIGGLFKYLS